MGVIITGRTTKFIDGCVSGSYQLKCGKSDLGHIADDIPLLSPIGSTHETIQGLKSKDTSPLWMH